MAIVDIRMPPTHTDEGLRAAQEIRARHPRIGIVILSQHVEAGTAMQLLAESPERLGYLLKDRVGDIEDFAGTLRRVAAGGSALDPADRRRGCSRAPRRTARWPRSPPREREVLALVAEGRSNKAIGDRLELTERAVQKHVTAIFAKLGLAADEDDNRRILAVLAYLRVRANRPRRAASRHPATPADRHIARGAPGWDLRGSPNQELVHARQQSVLNVPSRSPRRCRRHAPATSSAATARATPPSTRCAASRSTSPTAA